MKRLMLVLVMILCLLLCSNVSMAENAETV